MRSILCNRKPISTIRHKDKILLEFESVKIKATNFTCEWSLAFIKHFEHSRNSDTQVGLRNKTDTIVSAVYRCNSCAIFKNVSFASGF